MRKFTLRLFLWMTLLAPLALIGQELTPSEVNIVARAHFQGAVPGVTPAWKAANKGGFEAWFTHEGVDKIYIYDPQGNLRIKKSSAKSADLPAPLTASLTKQYGQANYKTAFKVLTAEKKKYFEIIVSRPTGEDLWHFTPDGALIGKRISSGNAEKPVVANAGGTPPPADANPVPPAPGYEDDSKDLGEPIEGLEILDEDPLEDIDIFEEEESDMDLLDEELLEEPMDEDFDDDMENDLNGDL